jgi:hypothetical protein
MSKAQINPHLKEVVGSAIPELTKDWKPKKTFGKIIKKIVVNLPIIFSVFKIK